MTGMTSDIAFEIETASADSEPGDTLLLGVSNIGMAGLTAVDHLVRHFDSDPIGHLSPENVPAIAPFENGEPRHHTRLYTVPAANLTVLVGELFIPVQAASAFTDALLDWTATRDIEEIAVLHGVPFPHGPDEHTVFHVATADYRDVRLGEGTSQPLAGGVLDGITGELVTRGLEEAAPPVGVFVTPTHPPGPDIDAALLLLETLQTVYEFTVPEDELKQRAEELKQYYTELAERMQALGDMNQSLGSRDFPEDRMYM